MKRGKSIWSLFTSATLFAAVFGAGTLAHAGFGIEPGVGYQLTQPFSYEFGNSKVSYNESAIPLSLQLYYRSLGGFIIGAEGSYFLNGTLTPSGSGMSGFVTDTFTRTVVSAIVGYYHPKKGFRIWAGYDALDSINNTQPSGTTFADDFKTLSGTGFKGGIGWAFASHLTLDVEYDVPTYNSITPVQKSVTGTFTNSTYNGFSDAMTYVSLTFPFGD